MTGTARQRRSGRALLWPAAVLAVCAGGAAWWPSALPEGERVLSDESRATVGATPIRATARATGRSLPPELARRFPPNTTVRYERSFAPHDFTEGIACPGGGFLPLLNGVPHAPPLQRNLELAGPVPPVVGKHTDAGGDEWHVHADGSETTSRWTTLETSGTTRRVVRTDHTVPAAQEHGLAPARADGGSADGGK